MLNLIVRFSLCSQCFWVNKNTFVFVHPPPLLKNWAYILRLITVDTQRYNLYLLSVVIKNMFLIEFWLLLIHIAPRLQFVTMSCLIEYMSSFPKWLTSRLQTMMANHSLLIQYFFLHFWNPATLVAAARKSSFKTLNAASLLLYCSRILNLLDISTGYRLSQSGVLLDAVGVNFPR